MIPRAAVTSVLVFSFFQSCICLSFSTRYIAYKHGLCCRHS